MWVVYVFINVIPVISCAIPSCLYKPTVTLEKKIHPLSHSPSATGALPCKRVSKALCVTLPCQQLISLKWWKKTDYIQRKETLTNASGKD